MARAAAFYAAGHPGQLHNVASTPCADPANATWRANQVGSSGFSITYSPDLASPASDCNPATMPAGLAPGQPLKVTARTTLSLLTPILGSIIGNPMAVSASVCVDIDGNPSTVSCH